MYQRILAPIDGSRTAARGLDEAIQLAKLTGAQLRLVHVLEELIYAPGHSNELTPLTRQAGERLLEAAHARAWAAGCVVETVLLPPRSAPLAETMLAQIKAWHADLVVMGTHGRRGINRLVLGSDAEQLVRLSPVPVLLVRGGGGAAEPAG